MNFESQRSGFDRESLRQFNNFNFKIRAKERGDIRSKKNKRVNLLKSFRKFNLLTRTPESKKINCLYTWKLWTKKCFDRVD